ncbi:hypothetical protein ACTMU2_25100 [Cupriavidus basilensis]
MTDTLAPRMSAVAAPATGNSPPLPQCLAAQVLRPPGLRWAGGEPLVARLLGAERDAAAATPGVRAVIVRNNFAGVVADSDEEAAQAAAALRPRWACPPAPDKAPVRRQTLARLGDAAAALAQSRSRQAQHYQWPLAGMQATTATCTAIADWRDGALRVWLPSTRPGALRAELAALLGIDEQQITLVCWQGADDGADPGLLAHHAAADAALMAHAAGGCVRRTITADDVGLADASLDWRIDSARGDVVIDAYAATLGGTTAPAVPLALWLTRTTAPVADVAAGAEAIDGVLPPYRIPNIDIAAAGTPASVTAAPLASGRAQVFALESAPRRDCRECRH